MTKSLVVAVVIYLASFSLAQSNQKPLTTENLRGLSAPSSAVVWASGTHGTYVVTINGGHLWSVAQVPGAESLDFRDVEAFSKDLAYLLAAGPGDQSRIYKTTDGGRNWVLQFTNKNPKGFFDCMGFWDRDHGIVVGDPVDGKFQMVKTDNGGKDWKPIPAANLPAAVEGEGAFAASGTCLVAKNDNVWFATGGKVARVFRSSDRGKHWKVAATTIVSGEASQGIFSVAFKNAKEGVAVGGDYKNPKSARDNIASTSDGGATWQLQPSEDSVYLSAVTYIERDQILACGPEGGMELGPWSKTWKRANVPRCNALQHLPPALQIFAEPGGGVTMLESTYTDEHGPEGRMETFPCSSPALSTNVEPAAKSQMLE